MTASGEGAVARTLRLGLLGVATLSVLVIGYELATERHWGEVLQLVPWVVLVVLLVAIALAATTRPGPVLAARVLAGLALGASLFGIYEHVAENHEAGPLDSVYSDSWENRSAASRWLLAATKSVGPAPPLAPGALGQAAVLVLLATLGRGERAARPRLGERSPDG